MMTCAQTLLIVALPLRHLHWLCKMTQLSNTYCLLVKTFLKTFLLSKVFPGVTMAHFHRTMEVRTLTVGNLIRPPQCVGLEAHYVYL